MKKSIIISFLWIACLACDTKKDEAPEVIDQITSASYKKSTAVTIPGQSLTVKVLEVNESRCPINVDCIQAGSADIQLSISDGSNEANVPVSFKNASKASGHQTFALAKQNYSLVVHEVLPYPVSTEKPNPEDYQVNLSIEKL